MKEFKKDLLCNITLIVVLALTAIQLLFLTLNLFGATHIATPAGFNYLVAYIMVVICLALYIFGFFISRFNRIEFPKWLRFMFYIAFFIFTNVYYDLGLFTTTWAIVILFIYLTFLANICALSVFYNVQKDDKNRLKTSTKFLLTSVFCYALAGTSIVEFFITAIKTFWLASAITTSLTMFIVEMGTIILTCMLTSLVYFISLTHQKTFINACIVKHYSNKSATASK